MESENVKVSASERAKFPSEGMAIPIVYGRPRVAVVPRDLVEHMRHIAGQIDDRGIGFVGLPEKLPHDRVVPEFPASTYAFLKR